MRTQSLLESEIESENEDNYIIPLIKKIVKLDTSYIEDEHKTNSGDSKGKIKVKKNQLHIESRTCVS